MVFKNHLIAYERKCRSQNTLDKDIIITTTAAGLLQDLASAALALTSDTPFITCIL
jgi:hypothetical protein